ncbi:MAG: TIGR04282 family arsenosugar biosynthesis glycosyltransferase [Roseobacter sp.]
MKPRLVVMLKEPRAGKVKTRLGRDIGMTDAAWWFRHQTAGLLRRLQDRRWDVMLAVSPDRDGMRSRVWPAHLPRLPQGRGDLGNRMKNAFRQAGPGPVCIIGGDIPGIDRPHIAHAFKLLWGAGSVIGPAPDGGFWLIGLLRTRLLPPTLFQGVRWSSEHALSDTVASMKGLTPAFAATLRDIDTVDDLLMTSSGARDTSAL